MRTLTEKPEFHVVELSKEDVTKALIEAAKSELLRGGRHINDPKFDPVLVPDSFGGYKVYIKAGEDRAVAIAKTS